MIHVIQDVILYTLNLYSAVCQLYVSKTGGKKDHQKTVEKEEGTVPGKNSLLTNVCLINEWKGEKEPWTFKNWFLRGRISEFLKFNEKYLDYQKTF